MHDIAKPLPNELVIENYLSVGNESTVVTYCKDYSHYRSLPDVIEYSGRRFGKTGWDSNTNRCHYSTKALKARAILYPEDMDMLYDLMKIRTKNESTF